MLFSGKITESVAKAGRRFVKFVGMGRDDVKEHRAIGPWGSESAPIKDAVAIYGHTSVNGETVVIGYINQVALDALAAGEHRIFSTDANGNLSYYLHFKDDGTAELGGTGNFLVKYNELKAELDKLKTSFNTHVHTGNLGGPTSTPTVANASDFSLCKHDKVKTV